MQSKVHQPLFLFYILVAYVILQFGWWSYLILKQDKEIYKLKSSINLLHHEDPQLIIEEGNELESKLRARRMMVIGEGIVFLALLGVAFFRVQNTFKVEEALAEQQKNFIHSVTHELKSPIASAKLQLETLLRRDLDRGKQKEILSNALADTDRLGNLVENILVAAQIENHNYTIHKEKINVSQLIEEFVKRFAQANRSHKIISEVEKGIEAMMDKDSLISIINNLLENAIKYSDPETMITIILKKQVNRVNLSIYDEGFGIPVSEKDNIFKKFYRVGSEETRRAKGTGLGLYITKYFVEKNGGNLSVKDNIPRGTIFEITFT